MTVGIFPLLTPYHAVEKSGAIVLIYRIRPNVIPGKIKPSHGLSALLRNICQMNVPSHTTNTAAMPANKKAGRKNTVYFTLLILYNSLPQQPPFFHHHPSKNFKTSALLLPKSAGVFFIETTAKTAYTAQTGTGRKGSSALLPQSLPFLSQQFVLKPYPVDSKVAFQHLQVLQAGVQLRQRLPLLVI